jgi:hypothetical protein
MWGHFVSDTAVVVLVPTSTAAAVVTPWRASLKEKTQSVVQAILDNEDPERQFLTAREVSEDITHAIKMTLRRQYGRVFDSLLDGAA